MQPHFLLAQLCKKIGNSKAAIKAITIDFFFIIIYFSKNTKSLRFVCFTFVNIDNY